MTSSSRFPSAFSLLETLFAVAVIGVLAAIGITHHRASLEDLRVAKLEVDVATINTAIKSYLANGGSLVGVTEPQAILDKMKTTRTAADSATFIGLAGSMIDSRLASRSAEGLRTGQPRAVWDAASRSFVMADTGTGTSGFYLDDAKGRATYGTEAREASAFAYNAGDGWVWNYNETDALPRPTPTLVPIAGLPIEEDPGDGTDPTPWSDPKLSQLLPPSYSVDGGTFAPSRFAFDVALTNPNANNSSWILVSVNGSPFETYQGPISVEPETTVEAFVSGDPYIWQPSPTVGKQYLAADPIQLTEPGISTSQAQFRWETAETISVTISNPNDPEVSALEYQIDGAGWISYGGGFNLAIDDYPEGATIAARAIPLTVDYDNSSSAIASIAAAPEATQLLAPSIRPSATDFVAGSVETITVSVIDPNEAGSELEYLLDGGDWQSYAGPFTVSRETYAEGVTVAARALATSRAYTDSEIASAQIGLTPVKLRTPSVSPSAPNFLAGTVESITVTIADPNATGSTPEYRINGGAWQTYGEALSVSRTTYASGLNVEARARATSPAYADSDTAATEIGLTPVPLLAPSVSPSSPNFIAGSVDTISVTVSNPNAAGSALDYRLNGGAWQAYASALSLARSSYPSGLLVEARARATSPAYTTSDNGSSAIGLTPVQLRAPSIYPPEANFMAGIADSISFTLTDPNPEGSATEFRLAGGAWRAYTGTFNVTRETYPTGLTVEARARSTSPAFLDSDFSGATVGLTPVQLRAPSISASQPNFVAASVETITVTVTHENGAGSALDYRLNGGSWQAYSGAFPVTRNSYPEGLSVEARARSIAPAYTDSESITAEIGLTPVQLEAPSIDRSAASFMAESVETISITVNNPNASESATDYRLNGGAWQAYSASFSVTRASYSSGLSIEARARATSAAYTNSDTVSSSIGLTPVQLRTPSIAKSAPNFEAGSVESVTVTLSNPNSSGSILDYRLNGGSWQSYSSAFAVTRSSYAAGLTVEARARSISPAYLTSGLASSAIGLSSVQLQAPVITPSAPNFVAGSVESVSVVITNPNASGAAIDYRLNGGSWTAYSAAFSVTRSNYATGLTVEARARSTDAAYTNSNVSSVAIGLTAVQLRAPSISTSSPNFTAGSVESVTVTLTNPNGSGSALDYRLSGGSWLAYSAAFPVTRANYPSGVTIEARSRSTAPAYTDSGLASATVGLVAVRLQTPSISPSAPNFVAGSVETISVTVTNPNATGSTLEYRLAGGAWQTYASAVSVTRATYAAGLTVEARARATSAAYSDSATASASIGLTPVQLRTPSVNPSSPNFVAGSVETISVTVTIPNATGAALEYRIDGGSWLAYSSAFNVTRSAYPTGLTVEARARATSAAYADSTNASATIGLTAIQLRTPTIRPSAQDFVAGSVETISVTLTNPNATGSTLQYRLNNGSWQNYSSAFNVTRSSYASGLTVEACARTASPAYADSDIAASVIGLATVQLRTPSISPSATNFAAGSVETISVTVTNPNATGSALEYRLNGSSWQAYTTAFNVTRTAFPSGVSVEARARSTSAAYTNSDIALSAIGLSAVPLRTPTIGTSAANFMAGSVETISVTVTNPNATGSILQYRINTGSWQTYSSAFNVTRSSYASGLTVEARALTTSSAFTTSGTASASIGLTAVQLLAPTITRSAQNFVANSIETITVTLSNPNASGSTLEYRLASGTWRAYTAAFTVTRSTYPSGVAVEARAKASSAAYTDSTIASASIGLGTVQLLAPTISPSAPNFMASSVETITVTLTNPNFAGSSTMQYRLNGNSWQNYSTPFNVTRSSYSSGLTVEARSRKSSSAYRDSSNSSTTIGLTAVPLLAPSISPSAPNFVPVSVETIWVTVTNPNASGSSLEYRLNGGSWRSYSGAFNVTRSGYATGLTVEARARSTASAYTDSPNASSTIGLTPIQLQTPTIRTSAPNFVASAVETVTVTLTNPNSTGSALDYRLNSGSWIAYGSSFNVTRSSYPSGVTVEARARSTSPAYTNSNSASTTIGVRTNVSRTVVTFTTLSSSAGYLNEAFIYVNGDAYYLGHSDMGAGNSINVDVYLEAGVTNVFDVTIDTYTRSGSTITSNALRGLDTRNGSRFDLIADNASFAGQSSNAAKIKDLSYNSNIDMVIGYEDLIITGGSPDYDYDDFAFELTASQNFNLMFGGYFRGL